VSRCHTGIDSGVSRKSQECPYRHGRFHMGGELERPVERRVNGRHVVIFAGHFDVSVGRVDMEIR